MDKPVAKVLKSKSSNTAITFKTSKRKNKKCKSNTEFQSNLQKRRGIYVKNKVTTQPNVLAKHPPKPRPGHKRFALSALTIISKPSTGSQYQGVQASGTKNRNYSEKISNNNSETVTKATREAKRRKYKSRFLNNKIDDKLIVLQSKKEIINTPSMYSEKSHDTINRTLKSSDYIEDGLKQNANGMLLAKEIFDGNQLRNHKTGIDNDPSTMIAATKSKDDKGMYSFFVDLLETTCSAYNLKAEYNDIPVDAGTSNINLDTQESVINRLVSDTPKAKVNQNLSKNCRRANDEAIRNDNDLVKYYLENSQLGMKEELLRKTVKRKLKANSYDYFKKLSSASKNQSNASKKRSRARRKQSLLKSLQEQLQMEVSTYEEPQNIYNALKLIARNKRKYEKSIRFSRTTKFGDDECTLRRRKLISPSMQCPPKSFDSGSEGVRFTRKIRPITNSKKDYTKPNLRPLAAPSEYPLEVYGFDYEANSFKKQEDQKERLFPYHSSSSISNHDFDTNEAILNYALSGTSTVITNPT